MTTSPLRVGRDDALDLLGGIVLAAVADGVGQRFVERQLDRHDLRPRPSPCPRAAASRPRSPAGCDAGSAGMTMFISQVEVYGISAVSLSTFCSDERSSAMSATCSASAASRSASACSQLDAA